MKDYGFAPGVTDYDAYMRKLLTYREDTTLIQMKGLTTVAGFFARLNSAPSAQIPKPVGDLLIASHGNDLGWMQIDLIGGGATNTDYDELTRIKNTPAVAAKLALPAALHTNADDTPAGITIHILGCRIGQSKRFMTRLMEVFGGEVPVTAPMHLHEVYELTSHGMFEHLSYGFTVTRPAPILKKADMVTAFIDEAHSFIGGTSVPDDKWKTWIPGTGLQKAKQEFPFPVKLGQTISSNNPAQSIADITSISPSREFRHLTQHYTYTVSGVALNPANDAARLAKIRGVMESDDTFQADNEYPVPERLGYADLDEFLAGYTWSFTYTKNKTLIATGTRHVYMVVVPVVDPDIDADPDSGPLLFNFYPMPGKPFVALQPLALASAGPYAGELFYEATP